MTPFSLFHSLFIVSLIAIHSIVFAQEGEDCGIIPADTIAPDYQPPPVRVGGEPGCTIGTSTECYCSTVLDGEVDNGQWKWHCGNNVIFGPGEGKTCPAELPEGECDSTQNPSGGPGDPGCGYGDCGGAATFSAICGCLDLSLWGEGEGHAWKCLVSTCDCPEQPTSASAVVKTMSMLLFGLLTILSMLGSF